MTLLATPVGNTFSHISYLLFCPDTGEAAAIDPFDIDLTLETARSHRLRITRIVNTHEHWDHAGRNDQLRAATGAKVLAAKAAAGVIEHIDETLRDGDRIDVGTSQTLEVMETPGHTMTHISLLGEEAGAPYLLCGDTLFGAGVGNCGFGGHAPTLFQTIGKLRSRLSPDTRLYPGHDYLARNLEFTLHHEPSNQAAQTMVEPARKQVLFTTIGEELEINLFLRLDSEEMLDSLVAQGYIPPEANGESVFLALRRLRDSW